MICRHLARRAHTTFSQSSSQLRKFVSYQRNYLIPARRRKRIENRTFLYILPSNPRFYSTVNEDNGIVNMAPKLEDWQREKGKDSS